MSFFLDLLYPARCVACGRGGAWWCASCRAAVERVPCDPCAHCVSVTPGHDADSCSGTLPFAGVAATGFYHSAPLRLMIAALKYDGVTAAAPDVESYVRGIHRPFPWEGEQDLLIVPMPLAPGRERERGFNQAAWIAELLGRASAPDVLLRRKSAMPQADVEHDPGLRAANVRETFQAVGRITRPVLLVDDVVTTGATAAEAARVLLAAGAPRVYLFALAVGK